MIIYTYLICFVAPPAPTNLKFHNETSSGGSIWASWNAPYFTNATNLIESYEFKVSRLIPLDGLLHGGSPNGKHYEGPLLLNVTVPGNRAWVRLDNFTFPGSVYVAVRAKTQGGRSAYAFIHHHYEGK